MIAVFLIALSLLLTLPKFLFTLEQYALFQFSIEVFLLVGILNLQKNPQIRKLGVLVGTAFISILTLVNIYSETIYFFFARNAIFSEDIFFLQAGWHFLYDTYGSISIFFIIIAVSIICCIFPLVFFLLNRVLKLLNEKNSQILRLSLPLLATAAVLFSLNLRENDDHDVFQLKSRAFFQNMSDSVATLRSSIRLDGNAAKEYLSIAKLKLTDNRPSIVLFIIESYGRMIMDDTRIKDDFRSYLNSKAFSLRDSGFHIATNYSVSTSFGGMSWLASSSLLSGVPISSQRIYNHYYGFAKINPTLVSFFKENNYQTTMIAPGNSKKELSTNMFNFEKSINFWDIKYKGFKYGWGNVPDQYAMNFALEELKSGDRPHFLVYKGVTSHTPWEFIPDFKKNHLELNEKKFLGRRYSKLHEGFLASMKYEWDIIEDFITKNNDEKAIYIIIGDHQPAGIDRRRGKRIFDVPIHVISKNEPYIKSVEQYGFESGPFKNSDRGKIKHEGFMSFLITSLFDKNNRMKSAYYKDGIRINFDK